MLVLPSELRERLDQRNELVSIVYSCLQWATPILRRNEAFFFPEYTDHGIEHVSQVIHTAWLLARPEARKRMTAQDCACLILSVLLHDFAMHIGRQGFVSLIARETPHQSIAWFGSHFDEKPWPVLWREFISEVARWDVQRCCDVYGDSSPLQLPKSDLLRDHDWSEKERMAAGEFIRRHHGRMAHEVALHGFPIGADGAIVTLHPDISFDLDHIADLSGLIARSHSLPLRSSLEYLRSEPRYWRNVRNPYDCHVPFIMALLRIADYIQIQGDRAPIGPIRLMDKLRSPISLREWKVHLAIRQLSREHDDPECVEIIVSPPDVETYLISRRLLDCLQYEIDQSWAVLGEVYQATRQENKRLFPAGLVLRRISSNLDDLQTFAKTVDYVPRRAQFTVVAPQMVQLLAEPLYGNKPQIAIRELTQNAVDAVFELRDIRATCPDSIVPGGETYELGGCDVAITLEKTADGTRWLICTDTGRGMTADVIVDYYFSIGSSFRTSHEWHSAHAADTHEPRFARSGRFGVGVLAAFLLGHEFECTTRSYNCRKGVAFTATPRAGTVELRYVDAPIGTRIRVKLGAHIADDFVPKHWYFGSECSVSIEGIDTECDKDEPNGEFSAVIASQSTSPPAPGWLRISQTAFAALDWSPAGWDAYLFCNGILVRDHGAESLRLEPDAKWNECVRSWDSQPYRFLTASVPHVSFIDHHGKLPLRLDRLGLAGAMPLKEALTEDYIDNILALWLTTIDDGLSDVCRCKYNHRGSIRQFLGRSVETDNSLEVISPTGVRTWETFISQPSFELPLLRELHVLGDRERPPSSLTNDRRFLHCHEVEHGHSLEGTAEWIWDIIRDSGAKATWPCSRSSWIALGSRWPTDKLLSTLRKFMLTRYRGGERIGSFVVHAFGSDPLPQVVREMLLERSDLDNSHTRLAACLLDPTQPSRKPGRQALRWQQLIGDEIPFDRTARQRIIETCRRDPCFERHLAFWETNKSRLIRSASDKHFHKSFIFDRLRHGSE